MGELMAVGNLSLFDAEDETTAPKVRDMMVGHATTRDATEFCKRYHYAVTGGNMMWRYGLWHGSTLWGVVVYNLPTRRTCESVFGPEHGADKVWHMGRLVLPDHAPRNSESRLIGGSLKLIERTRPDVWAVVTFAAVDAGHVGYVYQATNALYTGVGGDAAYYVDRDGQRRGTHLSGRRVSPERATTMGWDRRMGNVKHRYVYVLGDRRQRRERLAMLRLPILPYPKREPIACPS